jgi:hypothetical protein
MAQLAGISASKIASYVQNPAVTWVYVERVTRIELALSAWEVRPSRPLAALSCGFRCPPVTVVAPSSPWLMAR